MPQIFLVTTLILRPVWPSHLAVPAHVASLPLPIEGASISKSILAITIHFVLSELAFVHHRTTACAISANAMLDAMEKLSFVTGTIGPTLFSFAVLLILMPLAFVCAAILVDVLSEAVRTVLIPLTFISIAVCSCELPITLCAAISKRTFIPRAIWPRQHACAMPDGPLPLPFVSGTTFNLLLGPILDDWVHDSHGRRWNEAIIFLLPGGYESRSS
mmetsp:Transcript_117210/g.184367  ORF Transcript_117210/g.184367 Transcript_117210/m.184367 type:complete len:216 (+) Transcript_117210:193-840(+)